MEKDKSFCRICTVVHSCSTVLQCVACKGFYHINYITGMKKQNARDYCEQLYCIKCMSSIFPYNYIDNDSEFINVISESWTHINISFSFQELEKKKFISFKINSESETIILFNNDPETNYYCEFTQSTNKCNYYIEDTINKTCLQLGVTHTTCSIVHVNIRINYYMTALPLEVVSLLQAFRYSGES